MLVESGDRSERAPGVEAMRNERVVDILPRPAVERRVLPVRDPFDFADVIEASRMRAAAHRRRIDQIVAAIASDDADENAARRSAGHAGGVVAAMEIDEELDCFARVEAPREELLSARLQPDVDGSVIATRHGRAIRAVAAMNRDALCEEAICLLYTSPSPRDS